ncbi:restriction endonuclease subunit S [Pontibacter sp. BAB1700]|uniref:restriction endonuclease subunit S n=1 Tax=Pontibacter sp. BAB1700 TaxID=1144253 RepID=UPI00026BC576|nr:restriction endonuclease subunit S [Pontibacter sp. BAB1700]EJF10223.1 restriction modification system DNA specificity domain-containing protein [Pontibacter sp. BAB1700]
MPEFKSYRLGELTEWKSGSTPPKLDQKYWGGTIPWISAKNLTSYAISTSDVFITQEGLDKGSRLANEDSILLLVRGSGLFKDIPVGIVTKPVAFNQDVKAIEVNKSILDPWYLLYWIKGNKAMLNTKLEATGIGAGKFDLNILKELEIKLPPLNIQNKLANIARCWDDKIELNRRMNQTLEQMAQTLFRQYFVDGIDEENLPEGWRWGKVSDLGKIVCGKTPSKSKPEYYEGETPFIKIPDMHGETFIVSTIDSLSTQGASSQQNKYVPKGSICVSCIATVGLVSITTKPSQTNQQINTIVPKNESYSYYSYFLMKSKEQHLKDLGSGGTATLNVNTSLFSNIKVAIPNEESFLDFHHKVEPIMLKILSNQLENIKLSTLRDTLLPKLMSGEIDVMQIKPAALYEPVLS